MPTKLPVLVAAALAAETAITPAQSQWWPDDPPGSQFQTQKSIEKQGGNPVLTPRGYVNFDDYVWRRGRSAGAYSGPGFLNPHAGRAVRGPRPRYARPRH